MKITEIIGNAEFSPILVMRRQQHAEVIVAHVRGKIIPYNALDALIGLVINDNRFQYFNKREGIAVAFIANGHLSRNDLKLDRITIGFGVVPMRQCVEPVVNHPQGIAQVFLTVLAPGQIGEIGRDTRAVRGTIILIETNALKAKREIVIPRDRSVIDRRRSRGSIGNCGLRHDLPQ